MLKRKYVVGCLVGVTAFTTAGCMDIIPADVAFSQTKVNYHLDTVNPHAVQELEQELVEIADKAEVTKIKVGYNGTSGIKANTNPIEEAKDTIQSFDEKQKVIDLIDKVIEQTDELKAKKESLDGYKSDAESQVESILQLQEEGNNAIVDFSDENRTTAQNDMQSLLDKATALKDAILLDADEANNALDAAIAYSDEAENAKGRASYDVAKENAQSALGSSNDVNQALNDLENSINELYIMRNELEKYVAGLQSAAASIKEDMTKVPETSAQETEASTEYYVEEETTETARVETVAATQAPQTQAPTTEQATQAPATQAATTQAPATQATTQTPTTQATQTSTRGFSFTESEMKLFAAVVQMEAGGESFEGKVAVANVVLNRIQTGTWGSSLSAVIYSPGQFTGANTGLLQSYIDNGPAQSCYDAVISACNGNNNIGNYLYFCSMRVANQKMGSFSRYTFIGNQCFYQP